MARLNYSTEVFELVSADFLAAYKGKDGTWLEERMQEETADHRRGKRGPYAAEVSKAADRLAGFYWWTCCPGCLPDSDAFGPFETEEEAIKAAKEDTEEDE